jgi:hypothetical protein
MSQNKKHYLSFTRPAVYKIRVQGDLGKIGPISLAGMQVNVEIKNGQEPITVLIGQINDQAALSGVLNTLYDIHMSIISVNMLNDNP